MAFAAAVGEAILLQLQAYARQALDKEVIGTDVACGKLLDGLEAAAQQAGPSLLEQLFSWRQAMLDELGQRKDMAAQRKQLTIEALFLEAAARVVGAAPTHLSQQKGRDLEDLAFDWLLAGDANLAFPDPKNHKNWVVAAASGLLVALSPLRLSSIT